MIRLLAYPVLTEIGVLLTIVAVVEFFMGQPVHEASVSAMLCFILARLESIEGKIND